MIMGNDELVDRRGEATADLVAIVQVLIACDDGLHRLQGLLIGYFCAGRRFECAQIG